MQTPGSIPSPQAPPSPDRRRGLWRARTIPARQRAWNPSRRRPAQQGFTLLELVVVIVVIGILGAMSFPTWGSLVTEAGQQAGFLQTAAQGTQDDCNAIVDAAGAGGFGGATGMCDD